MKKLLLTTAALALMSAGAVSAKEIKIGIEFGFTGPIESITPNMAKSAQMAIKEVSKSGLLLGGDTVKGIEVDSTCIDSGAAIAAAERLVTSDKVSGIVGGDCSGVTGAMLQNVARPNGMVMISPSATSPALSTAPDDGLFFRTAPSDARQGQVVADVLKSINIKNAAMTYTNNDYGKGLADAIKADFTKAGGKITIDAPHQDGKADYSAEVAALDAAGGQVLIVAGYVDQGGSGIVRAALDTGAFSKFYFPDGMVSQKLVEKFGKEIDGSYGDVPGTDSQGAAMFNKMAKAQGYKGTSSFAPQSYDAAALILLSMQAANSSKPEVYKKKVFDVANAPGVKIYPGQLAKALKILKDGGQVDYEGASAVTLIGTGDASGSYREVEIKNGKLTTVMYR